MRASSSAVREQQREPVAVDEAEPAALAHGDLERGHALGRVGAGGVRPGTGRPARRAGRRRRRRSSRRWIARTHSCSGASSTTRVMIASAPGSSTPAARRSARYVVAVSKRWWPSASTRRAPATAARDRRDALRVGDAPQRVVEAVLVGGGGEAASASAWAASSAESPVARESPQIGSRLARVARSSSSRSLFAFGSVRSCGITSPRLVAETQRADHPGGALRERRRRPVKSMR